ncbi:hypothetical protein [Gloeobacter morelensis]|uniref:Peptidase A2 domain-containing protein n=1 Tax=Gloeobacter morelensis MG652769 TaxID=2781736 RepID=A0ABY3PJV2_9CYAN|nr:hypothetical protein [Gloeobacter morelensis]UFP93936.1 hypothetical protein ISF26_19530 [Gloeobacter morelensis MG652769]
MSETQRFSFSAANRELGEASLLPLLPVVLSYQDQSIETVGLLDTGAAVNVLPYHCGLGLGAAWEAQEPPLRLTGNLARLEARPLIISATIGQFEAVRLAFAWTRAEQVPVLLGQVNFFMEFDVCFYRSQATFDIQPRNSR